ncbi:hypothetical protein EJ04DRAFT_526215 [Polyplosphaeria fusca]|uniref:Zn(2)-C6 fungal-type domain-containing protein n=1 Tax=Polyplosphaeria fusca TaxID=682080 RepID=A0A9P4QPQ3_9PLEO|nr:hypothetical protein EJ04DRAFT_526215 [Polyplosphaeria fusca]
MCGIPRKGTPQNKTALAAGTAKRPWESGAEYGTRVVSCWEGAADSPSCLLHPITMPPDRSRTSDNAQGRQKSCSRCAKSKRRCDLRQPSCLRCSRQGLTCAYPPPQPSTHTPPMSLDERVAELPLLDAQEAELELLDFDFSAGMNSVDALNDLLNDTCNGMDAALTVIPPLYLTSKQLSPSHLTPFARSRIDYSIGILKTLPTIMVLENQTPWSHRFLYEERMPRCMQDAHACCALFVARNDTNAGYIARHVLGRLDEVLATPMPTSSFDILARSHAMLLYQIMFTFSDDVRYFGAVEALIPRLEEIGHELHSLVQDETDPTGTFILYPSGSLRPAWNAYIFRESARRTMIAVFHVIAVCRLLAGRMGQCDHSAALSSRLSFSRPLWDAVSPFEFAKAWNEQNPHFVDDLDVTTVLDTARPNDIGTFGRILLVSMMGIDEVKGWFHSHGAAF